MIIIYRHKSGFGDGTDHLEQYEDASLWAFNTNGTHQKITGVSLKDCERFVQKGFWTKKERNSFKRNRYQIIMEE